MVRLSMITWNPLEENCEDLEHMEWYDVTMKYAYSPNETEETLSTDPDIRLIPALVEKIILPKLTGMNWFNSHFFLEILVDDGKHKNWISTPFFFFSRTNWNQLGSAVNIADIETGWFGATIGARLPVDSTNIEVHENPIHHNSGQNEIVDG